MSWFKRNIYLINLLLFAVTNYLFLLEVINLDSDLSYFLLFIDVLLALMLVLAFLKRKLFLNISLFFALIVLFFGFTLIIRKNRENVKGNIEERAWNIPVPSVWETDSTDGLMLKLHFYNSDTVSFSMSPDFQEVYYLYKYYDQQLILKNIDTKKVKFEWQIKELNESFFLVSDDDDDDVKFVKI